MLWARSRTMRKTAAAAGVEGKSRGRWLGAVGRGDCGDEVGSWLGGGQGRICLTGVAGHGAVSSSILSLQTLSRRLEAEVFMRRKPAAQLLESHLGRARVFFFSLCSIFIVL